MSFKKKSKISLKYLLIGCVCSTMFTVGFSSWVMINSNSFASDIDFKIGSIEYLDRCFYFDGESELTKFSASGFLDGGGNVGVLKIPFQIKTGAMTIKDYYSGNSVKFKVTIRSENSSISNFYTLFSFNNCNLRYSNSDNSYSTGSFEYSATPINSIKQNEREWIMDFSLDDFVYINNSYAAFLLEVELTFSSDKNFATDVFNKLGNDQNIKMSINIGVNN